MKEFKIIVEYDPYYEEARVTVDRPGGSGLDYGFMGTAQEVCAAIKDAASEVFLMLKEAGLPIKLEE